MQTHKPRVSTRNLVLIAVFAALLCVVSPFAVPIGPVPISLATLAIYLTAGVLGTRRATLAVAIYIALGTFGMPVFTGFSGGIQKLVGPTGGYIAGYIPLALITGIAAHVKVNRKLEIPVFCALAIGATAILYTLGTAWFVFQSGNTLAVALSACVIPFVPGDLIKIAIAAVLSPTLRRYAR